MLAIILFSFYIQMFNNNFFGGFPGGFGMPGQNNGGLQFSFGIGAFPFSFLSWVGLPLWN